MSALLTTAEAAEVMGRSQQWVQSLIGRGKLKAQQIGKFYLVKRSDVEAYEHQPPGRPSTKPKQTKSRPRRNGTGTKSVRKRST